MKRAYVKPTIESLNLQLKEQVAVDCRMWGDGWFYNDPDCGVNEPYTDYNFENNCIGDGPGEAYGLS